MYGILDETDRGPRFIPTTIETTRKGDDGKWRLASTEKTLFSEKQWRDLAFFADEDFFRSMGGLYSKSKSYSHFGLQIGEVKTGSGVACKHYVFDLNKAYDNLQKLKRRADRQREKRSRAKTAAKAEGAAQ